MKNTVIAVVEDEGIVAMDIRRSLISLGYEVAFVVDSGEKIIEKLKNISVDVILMDIILKGQLDGIETANLIQTEYDIPIVFLTAYEDEATLEKNVKKGTYCYLIKPFDNSGLNESILKALKLTVSLKNQN